MSIKPLGHRHGCRNVLALLALLALVSGALIAASAGSASGAQVTRGDFYAFDALAGKQLFTYTAPLGIRASPLTYQVNGRQYVSVVASNTILTFGLP